MFDQVIDETQIDFEHNVHLVGPHHSAGETDTFFSSVRVINAVRETT